MKPIIMTTVPLINSAGRSSSRLALLLIPLVFACFALSPISQAVVPAPDGCYPEYTTAEGCNALAHLTTGAGNTGVGWYSLFFGSTNSYNTGVGAGTLVLNTADSNTAVGAAALLLNTTGTANVAVGTDALVYNDSGSYSTAVGAFALFNSTGVGFNTAVGERTLFHNTTGDQNTAVGTSGFGGGPALFSNTMGRFNTAVGGAALSTNTIGNDNTAIGAGALNDNVNGNENAAVGLNALVHNTGSNNVALGSGAGSNATTGSNNVYIGYQIGGSAAESNACYIKSIFGQTAAGGSAVFIDANSKLGTSTSSKRFKEEIKPMDKASDALFALKPVTFHYKKEIDPVGKSQLGLVAEDVEKVNPDLVVRDKEGKAYSVRYDQVNAMLLNEFLKEHRTVQELKKEVAALTAGLQKVSAQLEASKPAPQVVNNN
jgi:trimeric autotransporter adhesin